MINAMFIVSLAVLFFFIVGVRVERLGARTEYSADGFYGMGVLVIVTLCVLNIIYFFINL